MVDISLSSKIAFLNAAEQNCPAPAISIFRKLRAAWLDADFSEGSCGSIESFRNFCIELANHVSRDKAMAKHAAKYQGSSISKALGSVDLADFV